MADAPSTDEVRAGAIALFERDCPTVKFDAIAAGVKRNYEADALTVLLAAREVSRG